ncbi:MAG: alpha/beta fold hydrolase [Gemmobacter sp.]
MQTFTTTDGLRLAYHAQGDGLPLLCLPGLTRNMADFEPLMAALDRPVRLIRLDPRGRGASEHAPDPMTYNLVREGQDVLELLDHLGLGRAVFLGTSRGGLVTMLLAPLHGARIAGAILNDIGPDLDPRGLSRIMDYVGRPPAARTLDEAAAVTATAMGGEFPGLTAADWRPHVARWYVEGGGRLHLRYDPRLRDALIAQGGAGPAPDLWPFFDALAGRPLAVIRGGNSDLLAAGTLETMAARIPGLIAATVPGRGHVPFLDEPEALAAIRAVIDRCAAATR